MSDYTPTTGEVRAVYVNGTPPHMVTVTDGKAEFDRWLADHDRAIKAEAWDEGAESRAAHLLSLGEVASENPYRSIK